MKRFLLLVLSFLVIITIVGFLLPSNKTYTIKINSPIPFDGISRVIVNKGDWKNKTRQAGLVLNFWDIENPNAYLELAFQTETDTQIAQAYEEIVKKIGGFEQKGKGNYYKHYTETDFIKVINSFYSNEWQVFKETFEMMLSTI